MAELVKQYINSTKTSGIQVTEAAPIDDRLFVQSENALIALFDQNLTPEESAFITVLHDGLVLQSRSSRLEYIWVEATAGLIIGGYTYPPYMNGINGQDYGNKTYNFVLYSPVNKITLSYTDTLADGLLISNASLPYKVLNDRQNAQVSFKSSSSQFKEVEFPDRIEVLPEGIMVILDPKPTLSEQFKITIS